MTDIKKYNKLDKIKEVAIGLLAETRLVSISNDTDKDVACGLRVQLQKNRKRIEEERKMEIKPYNDYVKSVNALAKEVVAPIEEGERLIKAKLLAYEEELERKRQELEKRVISLVAEINSVNSIEELEDVIASINLEDARIGLAVSNKKESIEEQKRLEAERIEREKEEKRLAEIKKKQSEEEAKLAEEKMAIEREKREIEQMKEQVRKEKEKEELERELAVQERLKKAEQSKSKVRGSTTVEKFEILDKALVPEQYKEVNESMIRNAIKAGFKNIPGVRIYKEKRII